MDQSVSARRRRSKTSRRYYRKVPVEYVASYASTLLRQIKHHLGHVISFTREDLLRLPVTEFEQVATITRYRATCIAVSYLLDHGELVRRKFPDLCLASNASQYLFNETSVTLEYDATIRRLVNNMPPSQPFAVMHLVKRWRTDPQLTADTKRKAVRLAIPRLVREGLCKRLSNFEFERGT